ncbi:MAG TPA: hypothetical protein GX707_01215 [Epulopiscium sp.]|nr:hypothetical protein [Candidatus Epulonipiscium sp.]
MSEKDPKVYDDLIKVFCQSISDVTNIIIDSVTPREDTMSNLKGQVGDISESVANEIIKTFTPVVDNLKEKFNRIVIPAITENMESIIITINKKTIKIQKDEE